ncbi:Interleukin-3 receptor class 2 subunit beta [Varanus komodoensis]|nr:Interleukin-3 receptor class 2 subunit beta [Varanus komodoensis]
MFVMAARKQNGKQPSQVLQGHFYTRGFFRGGCHLPMFFFPFQEVQLPDVSQDFRSQCFLEDEGTDYANLSEIQMLVGHLECLQVGSGKIIPHPIASQDMEKTELPCIAKANQFLTRANMGEQPVCTHHAQIFDFDGPYISCGSEPSLPEVQQDLDVAHLDMKETAGFLQYVELPKCLQFQKLPVGHEKGETHSFSFVSDQVQEEKKQLLSKRQQISQSQAASGKLEKEENKPPSLPHTNRSCQTRPLDYIAVEDLSISKERDSSLSLPAGASKEGMPLIRTKAAELPRPTEVFSSSGSCQEKSEPVVQATGHSLAAPSGSSQEAFDDNVLALPGKAESVPKEKISLSVEEPKQDKGFLIFNPDGKKPVFLHQVGDYCFLPGSKAIREASKKPGETVRSQMLEINQKQATEPLSDLPRWESVSTSINPSPGP